MSEELTKEEPLILPDEAYSVINEYNLACTAAKEAEKRKEAAKFELLDYMGTAKFARYDNIKITHTEQVKETLDAKRLKAEMPDVYEEYVGRTIFMVMRVSQFK